MSSVTTSSTIVKPRTRHRQAARLVECFLNALVITLGEQKGGEPTPVHPRFTAANSGLGAPGNVPESVSNQMHLP